MIYGALLVLSVLLFELFLALKIGDDARTILTRSREAMRVLSSAELADDQKESSMRRGSLAILIATLCLAGKLLLVGVVLLALYRFIAVIVPGRERALLESLLSAVGVVTMSATVVGYAWARKAVLGRR